MKLREIREMGIKEAEEKIIELKAELAKEKGAIASGTRPENPGKIRKIKRTIAKIFTVINEKEKEIEKEKERKEEKKVEEKTVKEKEGERGEKEKAR